MNLKPTQIKQIAQECAKYAERYRCTLADAMSDFEFEDENGSSGLTPQEKVQVSEELRQQGFDIQE